MTKQAEIKIVSKPIDWKKRVKEANEMFRRSDNIRKMAMEKFLSAFPVGCDVTWMHGPYPQRGQVLEHIECHGDLWVKNSNTGKTVKVSAYNMTQFIER